MDRSRTRAVRLGRVDHTGTSPTLHIRNHGPGPAVVAASQSGVGVLAQGDVPLWLLPSVNAGPPTDQTQAGQVMVDKFGRYWICVEIGTPGLWVRPGFNAISPLLVCDTRPGRGTPYSGAIVGPDSAMSVVVAASGTPVPAGATAVAMNLTVTEATHSSYVTVYPEGEIRPVASAINFVAGQTIANAIIAKVGANGTIKLYNFAGNVQLIVDLMGFYF